MLRLTDQDFKYTPAASTDIRKTFARIERERKAQRKAAEEAAKVDNAKVRQLKGATK